MTPTSHALELRGIDHSYPGNQPTLSGLDLPVSPGHMVSVVGPSGSGKSTLLRVIAGLARHNAGQVFINGAEVSVEPPERRDLTMMFQTAHLFGHRSVLDNVAFAPLITGASRRAARATARRYLELVQLQAFAHRKPSELSGGQQQRVSLARALAAGKPVLLLDEPFSSLDRALRLEMHELLAQVREELNPTIVMVTHDLDEAGIADTVAVLADGHIAQRAPLHTLYRQPASLTVARLVGGFNEIWGHVRQGTHHSMFGQVAVDPRCRLSDGPACLLVSSAEVRAVGDDAAASSRARSQSSVPGLVMDLRFTGRRKVATVRCERGGRVGPPGRFGSGVGDQPVGSSVLLSVELDPITGSEHLDLNLRVGDTVHVAWRQQDPKGWAVSH